MKDYLNGNECARETWQTYLGHQEVQILSGMQVSYDDGV